MDKNMKKSYKISRIILVVLTLIILNILIINEDESWNFVPFLFAGIVFGLSFPSSVISRKIINIGNKLQNKLLRFFYYVIGLPIFSFLAFSIIYFIGYSIMEGAETPNDIGSALDQALSFIFWIAVAFICIILPYIQTLIVLIINLLKKD